MNDIVVGVDRSETAATAAKKAAAMAKAYGVNLHLVTCAHRSASVDVGVGGDRSTIDWRTDAETMLDGYKKSLGHDSISTHVGTGDPASVLCDEARRIDASVIVVGNRRVQGVSRVLGSIATGVARHAHCDVLVVNTRHSKKRK